MEKIATVFLDLDKIADSGQCFRWRKVGDREYIIPAFGKELHIKQDGPEGWLEFDCSREEYETVWTDYFDLRTNYARYVEELRMTKVPEYIWEAERAARGIRILRQDLWEVIVSFLISQNNNIPRIRQSLEKMCERFGGFPSAQQIAKSGPKGMSGLGLGYRDKYIIDAAITYCGDGDGTIERILKSLSHDDAMKYLLTWQGVGEKVANSIEDGLENQIDKAETESEAISKCIASPNAKEVFAFRVIGEEFELIGCVFRKEEENKDE